MRATILLILTLCAALPAQAASFCGSMLMPPANLREIARGFSAYHSGLDLMAPYGSPIRAAAGGTVVYAGWYFAYGRIVDIQHADGVVTRYAHMSAFAPGIARGTPVSAGEVIGQIGTSGNAHGAHVHFEVRINGHAVDPKPYLGLAACQAMPDLAPVEEARVPSPAPAVAELAGAAVADPELSSRAVADPAEVRRDR